MRLTEAAARQVIAIAGAGCLRIGVQGGGCSGLTYTFSLEQSPAATDTVFEEHGAKVCVDARSLAVLADCTLDWEQTLMTKGFVISNPNQKSSCSCGESFSL